MNAKIIRTIREKLGITQEEFASLLGTTKTSISRYSQDDGQKPQGEILKKLILLYMLTQEKGETEKLKKIIKDMTITGLSVIVSLGTAVFIENPKLTTSLLQAIESIEGSKETSSASAGILFPIGALVGAGLFTLGTLPLVAGGVGIAAYSTYLHKKKQQSINSQKNNPIKLSLSVDEILCSPQAIMLHKLIDEQIKKFLK